MNVKIKMKNTKQKKKENSKQPREKNMLSAFVLLSMLCIPALSQAHALELQYTQIPEKQAKTLNLLSYAKDGQPEPIAAFIRQQNQTLDQQLQTFAFMMNDPINDQHHDNTPIHQKITLPGEQ